jgi:prepilin-type N-terminal cleavage/methylation domain-containing protein
MTTWHRSTEARRGITLIELIVVIALLSILATLVVLYIVPSFQDNKNVVRTVDRVTTALLIAKQRALRDQAPRGVRFTTTNMLIQGGTHIVVQQLQYIEQPDPLTGGGNPAPGGQMVLPAGPPNNQLLPQRINFTGVDFFGGADAGATTEFEVQPGDYFCCAGGNYQIAAVPRSTRLRLARFLDFTINSNPTAYQIVRQTRLIAGENPITLPNNVVIYIAPSPLPLPPPVAIAQIAPSVQIPNGQFPSQPGNLEILFDPAGGVMNRGGSTPIVFVLLDSSADNPLDPNSTRVLTLYPRTGSIAANPVGPAGNPLQYALNGSPSGL